MGSNFASRVGPCMGIIQLFNHLLRVNAHPQILLLELRAPMGACPGQYGNQLYGMPAHFHFFSSAKPSSKRIAPTDNMRQRSDEITK